MQELQNLDYSVLVDLLSEHTAKLTRLMAERKVDHEYENCKEIIKELTLEIEARKKSSGNTTVTNRDINFIQKYIHGGKEGLE